MWRLVAGLCLIAVLMVGSATLHEQLVTLHDAYPTEFRSYYVPSSAYMSVASLGQKNFWADLVFIWSIQFFDRYGPKVRDAYLLHTYDVITDLDPRFQEAYIFGNLFLSLDKNWDLLYKLADKGIEQNPKNWVLAWDAGTYAFFQQKDYARALKYFRIAEERNPGDSRLQNFVANAYKYRGEYENSLRYWQELKLEHEKEDTDLGRFLLFTAERNIFDLTIKIDLRNLSAAVARFKAEKGANPLTLAALVKAGYIKSLPEDPEGKPYLYNAKTGDITCQTPLKFRGKFAQW